MYLHLLDLSDLFTPSFCPFQSPIPRHQRDSGRLGIATCTVLHSASRTHPQIGHSLNCVLDGDEGLIKRKTTSKRPAFLLHPPSSTPLHQLRVFFMNQSGSLCANIVLPTYKNGLPPLACSIYQSGHTNGNKYERNREPNSLLSSLITRGSFLIKALAVEAAPVVDYSLSSRPYAE